jgi:hypothetical protein
VTCCVITGDGWGGPGWLFCAGCRVAVSFAGNSGALGLVAAVLQVQAVKLLSVYGLWMALVDSHTPTAA